MSKISLFAGGCERWISETRRVEFGESEASLWKRPDTELVPLPRLWNLELGTQEIGPFSFPALFREWELGGKGGKMGGGDFASSGCRRKPLNTEFVPFSDPVSPAIGSRIHSPANWIARADKDGAIHIPRVSSRLMATPTDGSRPTCLAKSRMPSVPVT